MPNTNPQAILVSNEKIRSTADRIGYCYNVLKIIKAQATAENWLSLFPANNELIDDGSDVDGRTPITNQDVRDFASNLNSIISLIESNSDTIKNNIFKIAVNTML